MSINALICFVFLLFSSVCLASENDFSYKTNSKDMAAEIAEKLVEGDINFQHLSLDNKHLITVHLDDRDALISALKNASARTSGLEKPDRSSASFENEHLLLAFSCVLLHNSVPYSTAPSGKGGEVSFILSTTETERIYVEFHKLLKSASLLDECLSSGKISTQP